MDNLALGVTLMGPAPAPMERRADNYRMQLLLHAPQRQLLAHAVKEIRDFVHYQLKETRLHWSIDIDPIDLD